MYLEFDNLNQAFVGLCKQLRDRGTKQSRRGFTCIEIPEPVVVAIKNPCDRYVTIPERKWNRVLGWVESLWLARGENSLEMPSAYVRNLLTFSDDGKYMRAGYGPRIRYYNRNVDAMYYGGNPVPNQYMIDYDNTHEVLERDCDQLRFVVEKLKEDPTTREACITIHNPIADNFLYDRTSEWHGNKILPTKDTPCTRSIHFMVVDGKLNCYVDIRSNDIIWGFSAVNVFNFTFMQEYVANMTGIPVGTYYHKADNLHVYEEFLPTVSEVADKYSVEDFPTEEVYYYPQFLTDIHQFDEMLYRISTAEVIFRENLSARGYRIHSEASELERDWIRVFARKWSKKHGYTEGVVKEPFANPMLNKLFE